jgi:hypothetical protein
VDTAFGAGRTTSNLIVGQLHNGSLGFYNKAGTTNVVLDITGYFALPTPALALQAFATNANQQVADVQLSRAGRYLVTTTPASNLVSGDTNEEFDAFVIDRETGAIQRASVGAGGEQANGPTWEAQVSDDGRYVAFISSASNLVADDTNDESDVFLRDTVSDTTVRLNVGPGGLQADGYAYGLSISADGRRVAFYSTATNLAPDDSNNVGDVFVVDASNHSVSRISVSSAGDEADGASNTAMISGDGDHVVFESEATNLVAGDTNNATDVYVHDLVTGMTTREDVTSAGAQASGSDVSSLSISDDGHLVVFGSYAADLVAGDTNDASDVFIRDRAAATTTRITASGNQANGMDAALSGDGSTIVFASGATTLSPLWQDSYGKTRYVYRVATGISTPIRGYDYFSGGITLDRAGAFAVVTSDIDNIVSPDTDDDFDSFVLTLP